MLVPDTCTAGTLAKQSDAFLVLGSLYKKRKNYTLRLEVLRCKGPTNDADHLAGGFLHFSAVSGFPLIEV